MVAKHKSCHSTAPRDKDVNKWCIQPPPASCMNIMCSNLHLILHSSQLLAHNILKYVRPYLRICKITIRYNGGLQWSATHIKLKKYLYPLLPATSVSKYRVIMNRWRAGWNRKLSFDIRTLDDIIIDKSLGIICSFLLCEHSRRLNCGWRQQKSIHMSTLNYLRVIYCKHDAEKRSKNYR